MKDIITQLVNQQKIAEPAKLAQIIEYIATASFASDLLEVDAPLWGGFWHFDVLSPGYRLPAIELALLRVTRLDGHWPTSTTVEQFLADLHQAIRHPQAGVWTLPVAGEPFVIFAAPAKLQPDPDNLKSKTHAEPSQSIQNPKSTLVWYCAVTGQLHAGYRATINPLQFEGGVIQRPPGFGEEHQSAEKSSVWLKVSLDQFEETDAPSLAARLDREILRRRLFGV